MKAVNKYTMNTTF